MKTALESTIIWKFCKNISDAVMQMGYLDFCEIGPTRDVFFGPMVDGYYGISSINERIRLSAFQNFFPIQKIFKNKKVREV